MIHGIKIGFIAHETMQPKLKGKQSLELLSRDFYFLRQRWAIRIKSKEKAYTLIDMLTSTHKW